MKKIIGLLVISVCIFGATLSFAGSTFCSKASVMRTGAATSGYVLLLRNDDTAAVGASNEWAPGASRWFFIHATNKDAMLATALTALSTGKTVLAGSPDNTYPAWGYISYVYINEN